MEQVLASLRARGTTVAVATGIIIAQAIIPWGMMGDLASSCGLAVFCWWQGKAGA